MSNNDKWESPDGEEMDYQYVGAGYKPVVKTRSTIGRIRSPTIPSFMRDIHNSVVLSGEEADRLLRSARGGLIEEVRAEMVTDESTDW